MAFRSASFILCLLFAIPRMTIAGETLDAAAMDEMHKHFSEAYNRGDLNSMAATFTENAVRVTPSGIFQGRDAIRQSSATPSSSDCMTIRFKEPSLAPKAP